MKNKTINQLRAGAWLSYINLGISCLIPFLYTPIMLGMLGQAEYGLYSLSNSVIGYLSLLSFGFGGTIIRYISKARALGKKREVETAFGFFLLLYLGLAMLVLIGGWALSNHVTEIFQKGLTAAEQDKVCTLIRIMTFNTALSFPISVFSSIIVSYERYVFRKIVDMLSTIAGPIANLIALYLGFASVGMAVASTCVQILMLPLSVIYCKRTLDVYPRFQRLPGTLIREMLGFSVFVFIGSIVDMLFWATDKVILGMLASSTAVAVYNIGSTFNGMVMNLSTSVSGVLAPRVTGMVVKEASKEQLTELFIRVGRLQFLIIGLVVSGFTVFGRDFIELWAGPGYRDSYWIAVLTMFPLCIPLIQNTGLSIVVAQNRHQFRSVVYLIIAVLNAASTYFVVPYLGGIGAALCSCISYLLGQGLIMNLYYDKVTGINIPLFWKNILHMSVVPGTLLILGLLLDEVVAFSNWALFFAGVASFTAIYVAAMYRWILNDYEKDVIRKPVGAVLQKLKR